MVLFEPVDNLTKLYVPLWWQGQVDKLDDHSPAHCDLAPGGDTKFGEHGYIFDGTGDYLIDDAGRKIFHNGTLGEWSSIYLTDGDVPVKGSIQGTGTKILINTQGILPKITGKIILRSRYCPNLVYFDCRNNQITMLDVTTLTLLDTLLCFGNYLDTLDVSTLTLLTVLYCYNCGLAVLDVAALPLLDTLFCHANSMNQTAVDTILCDMDGHGTSNGILNISSNAVPSAAGIVCKNNLIARGWTVTTD